jgi:hypothetical protein
MIRSISFKWYDMWVGIYIDRTTHTIYVCPLPMLVIEICPIV